ncbi:hypothetical protein Q6A90_05040 [Aliarcobacter skirrowii]|uniref:hypothetical protein n=1 Tax=Aliarcobacter skirrowii TaxID=28200 RepID=UPI0029BB614E|nr:hypothetical protein [Aliarcobacter skirrowii]MDX4061728.1 hypothetical protein [Aliarcobacter skirrowii]
MEIQIIVDKNLVIIDDGSINIDCSKFKEQFVFCEVNEKEKWIEKEPFNGKEQPEDWNEIEDFIDEAKLKSNPPNSYSVWDEDSKSWIEDMELKKEYEKSLIPKTITLRQARLYLLSINLLDDLENIISQNRAYQIEWEYANQIERESPLVKILGQTLNLDDTAIDNMFTEASQI